METIKNVNNLKTRIEVNKSVKLNLKLEKKIVDKLNVAIKSVQKVSEY